MKAIGSVRGLAQKYSMTEYSVLAHIIRHKIETKESSSGRILVNVDQFDKSMRDELQNVMEGKEEMDINEAFDIFMSALKRESPTMIQGETLKDYEKRFSDWTKTLKRDVFSSMVTIVCHAFDMARAGQFDEDTKTV